MKILFLLLCPAIAFCQNYSFDGTWEGTYFCPSDSGRITLEIFSPQSHGEYHCALKTKTDTIPVMCFLSENNLTVNDYEGIFFVLYTSCNIISTGWSKYYGTKYSFYPEPELECYYEPGE